MPAAAAIFLRSYAAFAAGLVIVVTAAIWLLDPYGVSPFRLPIARPIMDINQRYMYPQIARSGTYDSAVIGTSTSRLLDPLDLDSAFGGRFANLAMNAATAWEQVELAKLYLRHQPVPRTLIIGLDAIWCADAASLVRITFRGFPAWMYDENPWNDLPELLNTKTVEITGRLAAFHFGWMPERIRRDGYEVFTPPEATYDLARARWHIWRNVPGAKISPVSPPVALSPAEAQHLDFPALPWLDDLLSRVPSQSLRMLAWMPIHVAAQPMPGSRNAAELDVCKDRIAAIARRRGAAFVDFGVASEITTEDSNYWDPLHYRLPIAPRIVDALKAATSGATRAADGIYRTR